MIGRGEALANAKRHLRGFAGAPDPRRHAQALFSGLARAEGWSKAEQEAIAALGLWLQDRPDIATLKPHCEAVLGKLR